MKKCSLLVLALFLPICWAFGGTLSGAWQMKAEANANEKVLMIATQNYLSIAVFEKNVFVRTYGGPYEIGDNGLTLTLEFDSKNGNEVGTKTVFKYQRNDDEFTLENLAKTTWQRLDKSSASALAGLWRITAREGQDGAMTQMKPGPRKTIKICSDGYFQWAAINTETKEFFGTGGGTYKLQDGRYTETLLFFSRDNNRVGMSLGFEAAVKAMEWQHTGKSSTGAKVNEIWTKQN
jgi:hypothetical protein